MLTPPPAHRRAGFTLIELLVVIAIIAILTAIIFPVFATIRENARQQTSISNLHQIQTAIAQFKLDEGAYPPVLFGYAVPSAPGSSTYASMTDALSVAETENAAAQYFPGIYPEYIKDPLTFTDPNNPTTDRTQAATVSVNQLGGVTAGAAALDNPAPQQTFYVVDAYDISPEIMGGNGSYTLGGGTPTYVARYQTSWTDISQAAGTAYGSSLYGAGTAPSGETFVNYNRQLRWTVPPADAYVTATTYHVPNDNRVIVLWESGPAKSIDVSRFLAGAAGNCTGTDSPSAVGANFWQVSPTTNNNPGYDGSTACP